MLEKKLLLDSLDKVRSFVALANTKEYEITLSEGENSVNAKQISQVFKLDLTKPVHMKAGCEMVAEFTRQLQPYICKDA